MVLLVVFNYLLLELELEFDELDFTLVFVNFELKIIQLAAPFGMHGRAIQTRP